MPRRICAALLAWWCVVLVSGLAPWVHAAQAGAHAPAHRLVHPPLERVCTASGQAQWVPSPFAAPAAAPAADASAAAGHHGMHCPLCLPAWALVPAAWQAYVPPLPQGVAPPRELAQRGVQRAMLPPVRAPPLVVT